MRTLPVPVLVVRTLPPEIGDLAAADIAVALDWPAGGETVKDRYGVSKVLLIIPDAVILRRAADVIGRQPGAARFGPRLIFRVLHRVATRLERSPS